MTVADLVKLNARTNTHLIGIAYVKDTHENLKIFMEDIINHKIEQLQNNQIWEKESAKYHGLLLLF